MQERNRYTTFRAASTAFNRTETIFKMIGNFLDCLPRDLANNSLQTFSNFNTLTVMDVYDKPITEVRELMAKYKIKFEPIQVNETEACSLRNLRQTSWNIPSGSTVDLLVYQGNVVGVHQRQSSEQPPVE
ncbi:MAG: hypothetical protein VKN72_07470 [Nostocales cyanobacterium 94392]|nr:hypothetical protein [Nostocales cyanobacterium 94392]